jgi:hypothetical protein
LEDGGGAINCSAVVKGNKVWIGHGEENDGNTQGRIVCLDAGEVKDGKPKLVWKVDGVKVKFASPILHEGLLYVCDDAGKLYCFDADKGDELWSFRYGRNTKGSPVWADGMIYVSEVDSKFHILKPSKDSCKRLWSVTFPAVGVVATELHGAPAIVNGRVYFTTTNQLICIGKKDHKASPDKIPPMPKEKPTGKDAKAAHLQIVPADATLKPGESVEFRAYAYDDKGRRIGEASVEWERANVRPPIFPAGIPAPKPIPGAKPAPVLAGTLSAESGKTTTLTAAKAPNGQFGRVVCKMGKLTGEARVRVTPLMPYVMDFEKVPEGRTPAGWVNAPGKFMVVKLPDGNHVLRKRNDTSNPIINNANAYISDPLMKDYTIEAEIQATKVRDQYMPDAGIGACQYVLSLHGNEQELRLVTWDAQKRISKTMPFAFKPKVWYHLKLTTVQLEGKGLVRGKVWAKGEKEPEKWTIEVEDPIPNTRGSPLIFGFAAGAIDADNPGPEIYYDNVKVTPNKK